jgi:Putative transmembrane protein (PGPGW)
VRSVGDWANPMRDRHDIWGDDPEERDAEAVVAEALGDAEISRRWHDHPGVVPFKIIAAFIGRNAKRMAITIVGFAVVVLGLILVPLPGPGWLIVFAGLAILATEYVWARRLLGFAKTKVGQAKDAVLRKNQATDADPPA